MKIRVLLGAIKIKALRNRKQAVLETTSPGLFATHTSLRGGRWPAQAGCVKTGGFSTDFSTLSAMLFRDLFSRPVLVRSVGFLSGIKGINVMLPGVIHQ